MRSDCCEQIVLHRRRHLPTGSEAIQPAFFDELGDLLDCIATFAKPIHIVGDFNVRLDRPDVIHASRLLDLLNSYGFDLRVNGPTHRLGDLLDVSAVVLETLVLVSRRLED